MVRGLAPAINGRQRCSIFSKGKWQEGDHCYHVKDHSSLCMEMILAASKNKLREMVGYRHRTLVAEVMRSG